MYSFFNLGPNKGWVVNATPQPLYLRKRPSTHCIGGWVVPRAGLDGCGKSRPPPGFDSRTVQAVASRYTDWAIVTHNSKSVLKFIRWKKEAEYKRTFWRTMSRWMAYIKINLKEVRRGRSGREASGPVHCPVSCTRSIFIKICKSLDNLNDTQLLSNCIEGTSLKICYSLFSIQYHNICYCCTNAAGGTETLFDMHSHAH